MHFQSFFYSDQRNWPNARAFDELRTHLVTVGRIDQMRSAFGQTRSAIGQMHSHLTNFIRILLLLVGLTKCAAHLGKRAAQLAKCAHVWPIARAIYQTLRNWSNATRLTNWSNALRNCPNVQIGQMRLTLSHQHESIVGNIP